MIICMSGVSRLCRRGGGRNTSLPINRAQFLMRTQFTAERGVGGGGWGVQGTRDCFWYPKWIKPDMLSINVIEWDGIVICLYWLPAYTSIQVFNIAHFTDTLLIFSDVSAYTMRLISSCCLYVSSSLSVFLQKCISRPKGNSNWVTFIRAIDIHFFPFFSPRFNSLQFLLILRSSVIWHKSETDEQA